jgi:hypothetical protein
MYIEKGSYQKVKRRGSTVLLRACLVGIAIWREVKRW